MAGVKMAHVPYKGTILALNDVLAGRLHVVFSDMPVVSMKFVEIFMPLRGSSS